MAIVAGVFHSAQEAADAITIINDEQLSTNVSYVTTENHELMEKNGAKEVAGNTGGGIASGAVAGGALGAIAGLAVANGILPGLGTLFVAGPVATALGLTGTAATTAAGAMTGAAAGGLVGALTGLGIGANEARKYEDYVREGDTLVLVDTADVEAVTTVFKDSRAIDVATY